MQRDHRRQLVRNQHRRYQGESKAGASNNARPYTQDDVKVLRDPNLTARQKADQLGRTYAAVRMAVFKYKETIL